MKLNPLTQFMAVGACIAACSVASAQEAVTLQAGGSLTDEAVSTVATDEKGNFSFASVEPGVYNALGTAAPYAGSSAAAVAPSTQGSGSKAGNGAMTASAPQVVYDSHPSTPQVVYNSHPSTPQVVHNSYPSTPQVVYDSYASAPAQSFSSAPSGGGGGGFGGRGLLGGGGGLGLGSRRLLGLGVVGGIIAIAVDDDDDDDASPTN